MRSAMTRTGRQHFLSWILFITAPLLAVSSEPWSLEADIAAGGGRLSYEEDSAGLESEWSAPAFILEGRARLRAPRRLLFAASSRLTVTDKDQEEWSEDGLVRQENQLHLAGVHALGEAGWAVVQAEALQAAILLGMGARYQHFVRNDLVLRDESFHNWEEAEEDVYLGYMNAALEGSARLAPRLNLSGRIEAGYIFSAQVENSLVSGRTLDGDDGLILGAQLSLDWQASERSVVSCGLAWELQEINGDTSEFYALQQGNVYLYEVEWPDNTMESVWAQINWIFSF